MTVFKYIKSVIALLAALSVMLTSFFAFAADGDIDSGNNIEQADRIYFYNIGGNGAGSADFIIVESKGHFGLIDTGHRYADTIEDEDKTVYSAAFESNLSSPVEYKNGRDAARYMINSLGVEHLDFIIGTHSHSDHIGGVPEIAALEFTDKNGESRHLVDENTVYIYKNYHHINSQQDDIGQNLPLDFDDSDEPITNDSWHNQAFHYQAVNAMREQGSRLAELSHGVFVDNDAQDTIGFSDVTNAINSVDGLEKARYYRGSVNDYYDDFVVFEMGNLTVRLYNLFSHNTTRDENVNSIVAVITDGHSKVASLADINVEFQVEQKLARAIYDDVGTIDLLKVAHHGTVAGSNSREMLSLFRPKYAAVTRKRDYAYGYNAKGSFAAAMMYAKNNFNTVFYEVGASDFAVVAQFSDDGFTFFNLEGEGSGARLTSADKCVSTVIANNGWSHWTVEWGKTTTEELYYYQDGVLIPNWYSDDEWWYYIDTNAQKQLGWQYIDGHYYYLEPSNASYCPQGAMYTGWNYIDGEWYYFKDNGVLVVGWAELDDGWYYFRADGGYLYGGWYKLSGKWYYFDPYGVLLTGWQKIDGVWYYLGEDGAMHTSWQELDGRWYYFRSNGAMQTSWQKIGGRWYHFNSAGAMHTEWQKLGGKWYYFDLITGEMLTDWQAIDGDWYYFNQSGAMLTGWQKSGNEWYYFDSNGKMKTGWLKEKGKWYYFDGSGTMATGTKTIKGKKYTFSSNGVWVK